MPNEIDLQFYLEKIKFLMSNEKRTEEDMKKLKEELLTFEKKLDTPDVE
jgi:hypothetical protein